MWSERMNSAYSFNSDGIDEDSFTDDSSTASGIASTFSKESLFPVLPNKGAENDDLDPKDPYSIDFIGTGTFQVSQFNVLQRRSLEPIRNSDAQLSARGKYHRPIESFKKDVQNSTAIISNVTRKGKRLGQHGLNATLLMPYFQRALSFERLNQVDRAITDYTTCVTIDPTYAPAFFNRAGLHSANKNYDLAMADLDAAIKIDPSNMVFHENRALVLRLQGKFLEAIEETALCRAVDLNPLMRRDLKSGNPVSVDFEMVLSNMKPSRDPIFTALEIPKKNRFLANQGAVIDFLQTMKFFAPFCGDIALLGRIACAIDLKTYTKGEVIFNEGDPGNHFFMILDGEVSIVKGVKNVLGEIVDTICLVKMFRGQSFGETALESKGGLRSAGATATTKSSCLLLHADDYQVLTAGFKRILRAEVSHVLSTCNVFSSWEPDKLDFLASFAGVKMFAPNNEILPGGKAVKHLYIIKKGIVKLYKAMNRPSLHNLRSKRSESPGLWVMETNWRDRMDMIDREPTGEQTNFTVGVLCAGQVFGELAVLDPEILNPVVAISFTPVELYVFDSDTLIALGARFSVPTMNALNESMNMHNPPAEKMNYYFRSKFMWEKRKEDLLAGVKRETMGR